MAEGTVFKEVVERMDDNYAETEESCVDGPPTKRMKVSHASVSDQEAPAHQQLYESCDTFQADTQFANVTRDKPGTSKTIIPHNTHTQAMDEAAKEARDCPDHDKSAVSFSSISSQVAPLSQQLNESCASFALDQQFAKVTSNPTFFEKSLDHLRTSILAILNDLEGIDMPDTSSETEHYNSPREAMDVASEDESDVESENIEPQLRYSFV